MANRTRRNKKVHISLSQPLPNMREPEESFSHNPEETTTRKGGTTTREGRRATAWE